MTYTAKLGVRLWWCKSNRALRMAPGVCHQWRPAHPECCWVTITEEKEQRPTDVNPITLLESSDIILIRKVDGEWPEWATSVSFTQVFTAEDRNPGLRFRTMPEVLDALSDSLAKEGER